MNIRIIIPYVLLLACVTGLARGQEQPEDPGLDELLGIKGESASKPTEDITKKLDDEQVADDFVRATKLMKTAADRLVSGGDAGIETQRVQEDVLRLLDKMIDQAQKQKKSKSKKKQSQDSQSQEQQQQQQQSSQQSATQSESNPDGGGNNSPGKDGTTKSPDAGNAAAWGNLPKHIRDALTQGVNDRFSSMYRELTEEYYKRLAKDPANDGNQERPK
jgi:hypothetical protein